jgi:hypothetical protein
MSEKRRRTSVDAQHQVARLEARSLAALPVSCIYPREAGLPKIAKRLAKIASRDEIRQGPAQQWLPSPTDWSLARDAAPGSRQLLPNRALAAFIPKNLRIRPMEWRDFPPRQAVIETEQFRAETNGKDQDFDAAPARDKEMAKLVEKPRA